MGGKGIVRKVSNFTRVEGSGANVNAWIDQKIGKYGKNVGVVGLFTDGQGNTDDFIGLEDKGYVNVDKDKLAKADVIVYKTNNNYIGPQMLKDVMTFLSNSNARTIIYENQNGTRYIMRVRNEADRNRIIKEMNKQMNIWKNNLKKTQLNKNSYIKKLMTPLKSGPNKGKVRVQVFKDSKVSYREPLTEKQAYALYKQRLAGQTDRIFGRRQKDRFSNMGFEFHRVK